MSSESNVMGLQKDSESGNEQPGGRDGATELCPSSTLLDPTLLGMDVGP
jgi:hypothetical protein